MFVSRVEKLRQSIKGKADAILVTGNISRRYYSGIETSAGSILVAASNTYFFADFRYYEMVKKGARHILPVLTGGNISFSDILEVENIGTLLFEDLTVTVAELASLKERHSDISFVPAGDMILRQRARKDRSEIMSIMQAQGYTDKAFLAALDFIRPGVSEREVRDVIESAMKKEGADGPAFPTIVLSGPKTSMPHGIPDDRTVKEGEFVLMDFGAKKDGYCSDMTRTVAVGSPNDEMAGVYATVLEAQKKSLELIIAGCRGCDIDAAARNYIYDKGFVGCFGHGLGHGVGLEIHESPSFSPQFTDTIPADSIVTVEPGVYLEGRFGVRTEDFVLVTETGYENLTYSHKDLIIL